MSHNVAAPDRIRIDVKLAGSMLVCLSASRHSSEFPANAIIASRVSTKTPARDVTRRPRGRTCPRARSRARNGRDQLFGLDEPPAEAALDTQVAEGDLVVERRAGL